MTAMVMMMTGMMTVVVVLLESGDACLDMKYMFVEIKRERET